MTPSPCRITQRPCHLPPPATPALARIPASLLAALCPPDQRHPLASAHSARGPDPAQPAPAQAGPAHHERDGPGGSLRVHGGAPLRPAAHRRERLPAGPPATPKPWGLAALGFGPARFQRGTHRHQCHQSGGPGGDTALRQRPQHFNQRLHPWHCCASPVYDSNGRQVAPSWP